MPSKMRADAKILVGFNLEASTASNAPTRTPPTCFREIANFLGENQRATCGAISFSRNAINVIPEKATLSIDLRNPDKALLEEAEKRLLTFLEEIVKQDNVQIETRQLARVQPEACHPYIVATVEESTQELGYSYKKVISAQFTTP